MLFSRVFFFFRKEVRTPGGTEFSQKIKSEKVLRDQNTKFLSGSEKEFPPTFITKRLLFSPKNSKLENLEAILVENLKVNDNKDKSGNNDERSMVDKSTDGVEKLNYQRNFKSFCEGRKDEKIGNSNDFFATLIDVMKMSPSDSEILQIFQFLLSCSNSPLERKRYEF